MPLVQHLSLPTFETLRQTGQTVLTLEQAQRQDIRELHIGFLNLMPDTALQSVERQFFKLIGSSNQIAQFYIHPFTLPGIRRSAETQDYLRQFYRSFDEIQAEGLDALIITGASITQPDLHQEAFWEPLLACIEWARDAVTSVLCSCLASHAVLMHCYGLRRQSLPQKRWGVYPHRRATLDHPLLRGINTRFDVPHSRWNTIPGSQMRQAGITPLIEDEQGEVHLAVGPDGLRTVFMQGHPEFAAVSLLKEYKREVLRFQAGERDSYPSLPEGTFRPAGVAIAEEYRRRLLAGENVEFPESQLSEQVDNTWGDTGRAIFNNWLGLVYQVTHLDRHKPLADHLNPNRPIDWPQLH